MAVIPIKDFVPDAATFGNPGSPSIKNAVPGRNSYRPIPTLAVETDALTARPRGAIEAIDSAGNVYQYAGDETALYSLSGGSWSDISKAGGYSSGEDERWEFVRWKEKVIATNFSDDPQQITFGGTVFSDLTTTLRFRHVAVVRDFLVTGYTFDGTDGTVRDRVRWSAINDETDFTVSATTLSDFRNLKSGGIRQIVGGEFGVILTEDSAWRMVFVGAPTIFEIAEVAPGLGLIAPGGATVLGNTVYYPSKHGFVAITGGTSERFIGVGRVDDFFLNDIDEDHLNRVSSVADPKSGQVYFVYPGAGNFSGLPNKILVYDTGLDKWGHAELEIELIWRSGGVGTTLEQLDSTSSSIDALGTSLDSSAWKGSAPILSAFNSSFQKANFSGSPMDATVFTKEVELTPGRRTRLNSFTPLVDGGTVTARVGMRNRQSDGWTYSPILTQSSSGRFTTRANARFHHFDLRVTDEWEKIIGVEVNREDAKAAERRG